MCQHSDDPWAASLPKIELHLHLEGAIPLPTMYSLVQKYGGDVSITDEASLVDKFRYRDFPHFLEIWNWKNRFIRELDDFTLIARSVAESLAAQNIVYAEVFFSPSDFRKTGMSIQDIATAIIRGLDDVSGTEINLVTDLVRDNGPAGADEVLDAVIDLASPRILGIGIGGAEQLHPPAQFAPVFERARDAGLQLTAHAGEAAGPTSVADAITHLGVSRIGHGTRAVEDEATMQLINTSGVFVEACPSSNVCTGVIASVADHPIRQFLERGIPIGINTDDPAMFGCSMAGEVTHLQEDLSFTRDEIKSLMLSAITHAWCDHDTKTALRSQVTGH